MVQYSYHKPSGFVVDFSSLSLYKMKIAYAIFILQIAAKNNLAI